MKARTILCAFAATMMLFSSCGKEENNDNGGGNGGDTPTLSGFNENGASNALFSVAENKQVRFSRGNLQYKASTGTWRFAEEQYQILGDSNLNISPTYDGWIEFLCWGTSGWNSGANCYMPYTVIGMNDDFFVGGSYENDLTGEYANADWGVYNAISNGGNQAGMWRTPTEAEWRYLFFERANATEKFGWAHIAENVDVEHNYRGLVILPDTWTLPEGLTFKNASESHVNEYTLPEWRKMEAAGAIFLPAAGSRGENRMYYVWSTGLYWASTYANISPDYVTALSFGVGASSINIGDGVNRGTSASVRLIQDVE